MAARESSAAIASAANTIVDLLNAEPFNKRLSLVELDRKSNVEKQRLLCEVVSVISPDLGLDLRQDGAEGAADKIANLLRVLRFNDGDLDALRNGFVSGDRGSIFTLLAWCLKRLPELQKKAYLAQFLTPPAVPPEVASDPTVKNLLKDLGELQKEFKTVHKEVEAARMTGFSPESIKSEIEAMQKDRDQLSIKLQRVKRKVQGVPNFEQQVAVVSALRREREIADGLAERANEMRVALQTAESAHSRTLTKLNDLRMTLEGGDVSALVRRQLDETTVNRTIATSRLPKLIGEATAAASELSAILGRGTPSERDFEAATAEMQELQHKLAEISERKVTEDPKAMKIVVLRQRHKSVLKDKESTADELREAMETKARLSDEVAAKEKELGGPDARMPQGEQLAQFRSQVRAKNATKKRLKAELSALQREAAIINRTVAILKEQCQDVDEVLAKLERERGISGYRDDETKLEEAALRKGALDQEKEELMQDITKAVKHIEIEIKRLNSELKPVLEEVTALRSAKRDIQPQWEEKKNAYDGVSAGLASNRSRLEEAIATTSRDIRTLENQFHGSKARQTVLAALVKRAEAEQMAYSGRGAVSARFISYKDAYTKQIEEKMEQSKVLSKTKARIKDTHEDNMGQIALLNGLKRLMEAKIRLGRETVAAAQGSTRKGVDLSKNRGGGGANVMHIQ